MPDTFDYMLMAYGISFVLLGLLVFSLYWRYRNLKADARTLSQLQAEQKADPQAVRHGGMRPVVPARVTYKSKTS